MPNNYDLFRAARVNAIMQALEPLALRPPELIFLNRTPIVPAVDSEIRARFTGRLQIADIVSDDAQALIYQAGKFTFEQTAIPNIKHGAGLTQEMLNELMAVQNRGGIIDPDGIFSNYEARTVQGLLTGIQQRMEAMIIAMHLDGFSYDRLGLKMSGVTWGTPSDLKVTPSVPWTTAGSAVPLTDIRALQELAVSRYGQRFNRLTMSTAAFNALVASTQFKEESRTMFIGPSDAIVASFVGSLTFKSQQEAVRRLLDDITIELYDSRYWSQDEAGVITSARFLPIGKVIFSNTGDDNNPAAFDFANGEVTEFKVAQMAGGIIGVAPAQARGPVSYATLANPTLNPPGIVYWGVARGFPRKHLLQSTAVMTIGEPSDPIGTAEP